MELTIWKIPGRRHQSPVFPRTDRCREPFGVMVSDSRFGFQVERSQYSTNRRYFCYE